MSDVKLTRQSEAILAKLRKEVLLHKLSQEQYEFLEQAVQLRNSVGILTGIVIKAAVFAGAVTALYKFFPGGPK